MLTIQHGAAIVAAAAIALAALAAAAPARALQAPASPGWQRTDLRPLTQPAPAGGLLVMYAAQGGSLQVIAVDPGSGRTVWSRAASPASVTLGQTPELSVVGNTVIFLGRGFGPDGAVTAVDGRTGAIVWQTRSDGFTTWPGLCPGNAAVVCVSVSPLLEADTEARFDVATGRPLRSVPIPGADGAREVGDGLVDPGARDPEHLVAVRGGSVAWNRRLADVFGRGTSTDFGWNIGRYDALGLFVGSTGPVAPTRRGRTVFDYGDERTVGFRIADGRPVWRARGFYACATLPCPGDGQAGYHTPTTPLVGTLGLRLVARGTLTFRSRSDLTGTVSKDARVRLEAFAPSTGRAVWRFDAGRNVSLLDFEVPAQTGVSTIALPDASRRLQELDLATGARRAVSGGTTGWCRRDVEYRVDGDDRAGQQALFPCAAATGRRIATPATVPAFVGGIGATGAGLIAWADTTGLFARPAAP
jgi:hypothetical protein